MEKQNIFETERLILRPICLDDAEFIFNLLNSPKWKKFIGDRNVNSVTDAEKYISERMLPHLEQYKYGSFTVITKENGAKIGNVGIYNRPGLDIPDIGFAFLNEFEGKGYGYEASKRILEAGFVDFGLNKISAITVKNNTASQKLIKKLGLKFIKIINLPNDSEDLLYYEADK